MRDAEFPEILLRTSGSERLLGLYQVLHRHMLRYRFESLSLPETVLRSIKGHRRIVNRIQEKDESRVRKILLLEKNTGVFLKLTASSIKLSWMDEMIEIRFQGRGGQGVVVASEILSRACFEEGHYPQCFSVFGGERRGAPVASFIRISDEKIYLKCDIDRPDHLVFFDGSLFDEKRISEQVTLGGVLLLNTDEVCQFGALGDLKVGQINALEISKKNGLGSIVNTAILGAYVRLTQIVGLESLLKVIEKAVPAATEQNVAAAKEAYEKLSII